MKAIYIPAEITLAIELVEIDESQAFNQRFKPYVGPGYVERVSISDHRSRTKFVKDRTSVTMLVNDEGLIQRMPWNKRAGTLYGTQLHGSPIAGGAVLLGEKRMNDGDIDFCDLPEHYQNLEFWTLYFSCFGA